MNEASCPKKCSPPVGNRLLFERKKSVGSDIVKQDAHQLADRRSSSNELSGILVRLEFKIATHFLL